MWIAYLWLVLWSPSPNPVTNPTVYVDDGGITPKPINWKKVG